MKQLAVHSVLVLGVVVGCAGAGRSFVRVDPPLTAEGVSVALIEESCALDQDVNQAGAYVLDLSLTVQLTNGATRPVTFHPERSRLTSPVGEIAADDRPEEIGVGPGSKKTVRIHFIQKGRDLGCNAVMKVALDRTVELDHKPIPLSPMSFQASNSPDS